MVETKFTTSFIPKKPIQTATSGGRIKKSGSGFFSLITLIIFIITLVGFGGSYFYRITLEKQKESQIQDLQKAREFFNPQFISEANRLNSRILGVRELLNKHTSPSQIFDLFETHTLATVSFSNLTFQTAENGGVRVSASGLARGFESIVLQSDEYGKSGFMRDVIFSGLQPNAQGAVGFGFESTVDEELIYYRNTLGAVPPAEEGPQASSRNFFINNTE